MNQSTLQILNKMHLYGMSNTLKEFTTVGASSNMTIDQAISILVQSEWEYRENRRIQNNLKCAKFRYSATMENIDYSQVRNLDRNQFLRFAECSYITNAENILISGYTGVGKSYIATALGNQACLKGRKVFYKNAQKLFASLRIAKIDGSYLKELEKIEKTDLLIIDDFGLEILDSQMSLTLLEILEDRINKKSTIIASQLPFEKWYEIISEATIADAIIDRLFNSSHKIEIKGESMRKKR